MTEDAIKVDDYVEVRGDVDRPTPLVGIGVVTYVQSRKDTIKVDLFDTSRGEYPGPRRLRTQEEVNKSREGKSWYVEPHLCIPIDREDYHHTHLIQVGDFVSIHGTKNSPVEGCVGSGIVEEEYDDNYIGVRITDTSSTTWAGASYASLKEAKKGRLTRKSLWMTRKNLCQKVTAESSIEEDEEVLVDLGDL